MTARARLALATVALLALVALAYAPARKGVFIWDDHALVEASALVTRGSVVEIFLRPFLATQAMTDARPAYYRPLAILSLRADHALAGPDPASFHVSNIIFHLLAIAALVLAARRLGASAPSTAIAAAWWALNPRSTESVAWISGRTDVLATLFALTAVALWPWYGPDADSPRSRARWKARVRAGAAGLAVLLALLAKEVAVAAVLAIVVGTIAGTAGPTWRARAGHVGRRLVYVAVPVAAYTILRLLATRHVTSKLTSIGAEARTGTFLEAVGRYVEMTIDPWHPAASIGLFGEIDRARAALGALALSVTLAVAVRALLRRRRRSASNGVPSHTTSPRAVAIAVALMLTVGSLSLVVHVIPIGLASGVAADRLLYLPLAGLALACAVGAERLSRRGRMLAGGGALAITATFVPVTNARARDYTDELRFRVVAAEHAHPHNTSAKSGLANTLRADGDVDLACRLHESVQRSLERSGRTGTARHMRALENLGGCYEVLGAYDRAAAVYRQLLALQPDAARVHMELGYLHLHAFELEGAEAELRTAVARDPALVPAREALAELPDVRARLSRLATPEAQQADPVGWAVLLTRTGRRPDAISAWLPIVEDPSTTDSNAWSGYEFLVHNADYATARRAGEAYFRRTAIDVPLGKTLLAGRRAKQASIDALRPRIERLATE